MNSDEEKEIIIKSEISIEEKIKEDLRENIKENLTEKLIEKSQDSEIFENSISKKKKKECCYFLTLTFWSVK